MKKTLLKKYANLLVTKGINVQKGQSVFITADVEQYKFVTLLVDAAYKSGADLVAVDWTYQSLTILNYRHRSLKSLSQLTPWAKAKYEYMSEKFPCRISLLSDDPDGLNNINFDKLTKTQRAVMPQIKPYRDKIENKHQWLVAAVPGEAWAKKLFPNERKSVAVEKLWQAILKTCHVTEDNDPVAEWDKANALSTSRCEKLNEQQFEYLTYKSSNGTDLKVGLMPESRWFGGLSKTLGGIEYNPNMPTEEVFTSPKKGIAEGRLVSTMPLSHNGRLVENFEFTFKNGKVVSYKAEKGEDVLKELLDMDEGASYLGEVALVPKESPIKETGILFYNTLFDENASCHFALGKGYSDTIEGFESMTEEDFKKLGLNESVIHVDFMVGTDDLVIKGHKGNKEFTVFENGTWAF
ncbi:aminopeptidase [Eubacteriales bacterium OttesenSCG-928-G02]|nr:aminopeptidase [Eubacteriales bacterium OttesenSCG-928-G02]